jgi:uncharacterized membrane protein
MIYMAVTGYWVVLLMTAFIGLTALVVREEFGRLNAGSGFFLFPVIIIGFSCLIVIGVDFIRVGDDIGRMNTLFKFYLEVWILMALGSAIGLWYLMRIGYFDLGYLTRHTRFVLTSTTAIVALLIVGLVFWSVVQFNGQRIESQSSWVDGLLEYSILGIIFHAITLFGIAIFYRRKLSSSINPQALSKAFLIAVLAILVVSSSIYVVLGSRARLSDRFIATEMTLNGEKFLSSALHSEGGQEIDLNWDYQAIRWLRSNAVGSPVVLEAHLDQYHWGGRFSIYTGLPTVLGWPWHQFQQRGASGADVSKRAADIRNAYTTHDIKRTLDILYNYDVSYVVVGDLERSHYPRSGMIKFVGMVRRGYLESVYDNGHTAIYRVLPQS